METNKQTDEINNESKKTDDGNTKLYLSNEVPEMKNNSTDILHGIMNFFARNYILINHIYAVILICIAVIVLLFSLASMPLLALVSFVGENLPSLLETPLITGFLSFTVGSIFWSILKAVIGLLIAVIAFKTAKYADKQAILVLVIILEIILHNSLIIFILTILAWISKILALYIYKNRSVKEQVLDIGSEFETWFNLAKK